MKHWLVMGFATLILAGCADVPVHVLDPADRAPAGGREARIFVPQTDIRAIGTPSHVSNMGLVVDAISQSRADKAAETIRPVRDALIDYNFDQRAVQTAQTMFQQLGQLGVTGVALSTGSSRELHYGDLQGSDTQQAVFMDFDYELTADYSSVRVGALMWIASKTPPAGETMSSLLSPRDAIYSQMFVCLVPLKNPGSSPSENVQAWSANNGKRVRQALDQGLKLLAIIAKRNVVLTAQEAAQLSQAPNSTVLGFRGKLIEQNDAGTLLSNPDGMWIYVAHAPPD